MACTFSNDNLLRTANLPAWNAFSVCGWARRNTDLGTYSTIFSLANGASSPSEFLDFQARDNGDTLIVFTTDGASSDLATVSNGQNFFWAMTSNGTNVIIYFALAGATSLTSVSTGFTNAFTVSHMRVGINGFGEYWDGDIGYVRVWDATLSAAAVFNEYLTAQPRTLASLNIFSPLMVADDVKDFSGNGRDWTLTGAIPLAQNFPVKWSATRPRLFLPIATVGGTSILRQMMAHHG